MLVAVADPRAQHLARRRNADRGLLFQETVDVTRQALGAIDAALVRGEPAIDEDFAFHRAIAAATGNPQFPHFLEYLGRFIIPRQSIRVAAHRPEGQRAYLETFQREHVVICDAIAEGDAAVAREAMRQHLGNSQARYRRLAAAPAAAGPGRIFRKE